MEPTPPNTPASTPGSDNASTPLMPGTSIQPVIISPTEPVSSASSDLHTSPSAAVIGTPALAPAPQPLSVPSLAVPQPGSLSATPEPTPVATTAPLGMPQTAAPAPVSAPSSQPTPQPIVVNTQPNVGATQPDGSSATSFSQPPKRKRKFVMLGSGIALGLVLLSGGVFGLYLPNTPTSVYSTGINRSGKALNALVTTATDQKQLAAYNTSAITGSVVANVGSGSYSGDFNTTFSALKP
jgi:hypothetical protein